MKTLKLLDSPSLGSAINSNGDSSQEVKRRLTLGKAAMAESGKFKSKDVALETMAKTIHTLTFPVVIQRCESWTVREKVDKKLIYLKYGVGGELYDYARKTNKWVFE